MTERALSCLRLYYQWSKPVAVFQFFIFYRNSLVVSAGGVGVGLITGWILSKLLRFTSHPDYLVMLSVLTAYGSFLLAEQFGFSGVLATVVSGIMLSFAFAKKEQKKKKRLEII